MIHSSHQTRMSIESSIYDHKCTVCGLTDNKDMSQPCRGAKPENQAPISSKFAVPVHSSAVREDLNAIADSLLIMGSSRVEVGLGFFFTGRGIAFDRVNKSFDVPYEEGVSSYTKRMCERFEDHLTTQHPELQFLRTRDVTLVYTNEGVIGYYTTSRTTTLCRIAVRGYKPFIDVAKTALTSIGADHKTNVVQRLLIGSGIESNKVHGKGVTLPTITPLASPATIYPWFDKTPQAMWEDFNASDSNILLLLGQPGTGKSSYIKEMLCYRESSENVYLADRDEVLAHPTLNDFIRELPRGSVLIVEDADKLVMRREDGNGKMSGLLNATSGIVPTDTKIIISTNLANTNRVDEALLRPGRTFRILHFRSHTHESAHAVRETLGLPPVKFSNYDSELTLAEVVNYETVEETQGNRQHIGF